MSPVGEIEFVTLMGLQFPKLGCEGPRTRVTRMSA